MKPFVIAALLLGAFAAPTLGQGPQFVGVWISGSLDSIYNAEYERVQATCRGAGDACYASELDTTAVRLAPVWASPGASDPVGWLAARLRPRGAWPYAELVFSGADGRQVSLIDDLGDWGYGTTIDLVEARDGWIRPWMLRSVGGYWLSSQGGPGLGIAEGPYGLEGRLWRLGPVGSSSGDALPAAVYMVLAVSDGLVRLRAEVPSDMDCGEPVDGPTLPAPRVYEVPLGALTDAVGRPTVEVAYPKGC